MLWLSLFLCSDAAVVKTYNFTSQIPNIGNDHFFIPFEVPPGVVEIEVSHASINSTQNILDFGINDTVGFRGWSGAGPEPSIVGEKAASRCYLTGPTTAGNWSVVVGKARIVEAAYYSVNITLRDSPILPPQTERQPYKPSPPLIKGPRWFAGDFHVHSWQSDDGRPTLDQIAKFASSRGLDFIMTSDHNTVSQLDYIVDTQSRWPNFLLVPGVEWTSYYGHANGIGATKWVDHKIGLNGWGIEDVANAFAAQGALLSLNHIDVYEGDELTIPNNCIGCTWDYLFPRGPDAMEIAVEGWNGIGQVFSPRAIDMWDHLCAQGFSPVPVGGSDDHHGGNDTAGASPIGNPTTMVYADNLDAASIVDGVRRGRTVVKMHTPQDPMIDFVLASELQLKATVTSAPAHKYELRIVRNNAVVERHPVNTDPFTVQLNIVKPVAGRDRWRAEVYLNTPYVPATITNHIYIAS